MTREMERRDGVHAPQHSPLCLFRVHLLDFKALHTPVSPRELLKNAQVQAAPPQIKSQLFWGGALSIDTFQGP